MDKMDKNEFIQKLSGYILGKLNKPSFSPREIHVINNWYEQNIPVEAIIKAFDEEYIIAPINKKNKVSIFEVDKRIKENLQKYLPKTETKPEIIEIIEKKEKYEEKDIYKYWKKLKREEKEKFIKQAIKELKESGINFRNINIKRAVKIKIRAKIRKILEDKKDE